jgi:hypothetical protein
MKHLKTFESLYESPLVIELKDMALELTDAGFNVQIFKDCYGVKNDDDNILIIITRNKFTMFRYSKIVTVLKMMMITFLL